MSRTQKLRGIAALPKSYFSLFTSPLIATIAFLIVSEVKLYDLLYVSLFFFLSTAFLNSFNNLMDVAADSVTKNGFPLPTRVIGRGVATSFSLVVLFIAFVTLIPIDLKWPNLTIILILDLILGFLYSAPKIRLKRFPILKGTILILHTAIIPIIAGALVSNKNVSDYLTVIVPLYLIGLAVHTVQDIGDIAGDVLVGDWTFPSIFGVKISVLIMLLFYLAAAVFIWIWVNNGYKNFVILLCFVQGLLSLLLLNRPTIWKIVYWMLSLISVVVLFLLLIK